MAIHTTRKTAPESGLQEALDLLGVLVAQKVLSPEQADKVRRAQRVNGLSRSRPSCSSAPRATRRSLRRSPRTPGCPT